MKCIDHIKFIKKPTEKDLSAFGLIEQQAKDSFSNMVTANEYVSEVMQLFHNAYKLDPHSFIKDVFFQNQLAIRNTKDNQDYIFEQFEEAKDSPIDKKRQIQLVNIYRNIISDLFEPYLSILVACIHLEEGTFQSFLLADLSASENNKYEFLYSRLRPTNLFKGYFPVIRNAVSHTGSHSISYQGDYIIFKKIRRGQQPEIADVLKVSTAELIQYIHALCDFTQSIDVSINIFGIDIHDIIIGDPNLSQEFFEKLMTEEQLKKGRKIKDKEYSKIWFNQDMLQCEKYEHFAELFTEGCQKYQMPAQSLRFIEDKRMLLIKIPFKKTDFTQTKDIINRTVELIRYGILAEQYFHFSFDTYLIEEEEKEFKDTIQVWIKGTDLKAYNEGDASFFDLLHDGKIYKNHVDLSVIIDFKALDDLDLRALKNTRPHKKRQ